MDQLKFKDLIKLFDELKEKYSIEEILEMPIYIADDDEVNGIHCAWYRQLVDVNEEDDDWIVELINENSHNHEIKDKAIFIS